MRLACTFNALLFITLLMGCQGEDESETYKTVTFDMEPHTLYLETKNLPIGTKVALKDRLGKEFSHFVAVKTQTLFCIEKQEDKISTTILGDKYPISVEHFYEDSEKTKAVDLDNYGFSDSGCFYIPPYARMLTSHEDISTDKRSEYSSTMLRSGYEYISSPEKGEFEKTADFKIRYEKYEVEQKKALRLFQELDVLIFRAPQKSVEYNADLERWEWMQSFTDYQDSREEDFRHNGFKALPTVDLDIINFRCGDSATDCPYKFIYEQSIDEAKRKAPELAVLMVVFNDSNESRTFFKHCEANGKWHTECQINEDKHNARVYLQILLLNNKPSQVVFMDDSVLSDETTKTELVNALQYFMRHPDKSNKPFNTLMRSLKSLEELNSVFLEQSKQS